MPAPVSLRGAMTAGLDDPAWEPYPAAVAPGLELLRRRQVLSPQLRNYRDLLVALPPGYDTETRRYPVVYLHDGQNLFDPDTSHAGDWGLGAVLASLAEGGVEVIAVGIPNAGRHRVYEYGPFRDPRLGGGGGDRYLDFLAESVKPLVDRSFRTDPRPEATAVAGSSMGGLISLYALYRHPEVFGAAGALSPSVWFADRAILRYVERWSAAARGRLYLDVGAGEGPGPVADVRALRDILVDSGRRLGDDLDYVEDEDGTHHEAAWGRRARRALPWLLAADRSRHPEKESVPS